MWSKSEYDETWEKLLRINMTISSNWVLQCLITTESCGRRKGGQRGACWDIQVQPSLSPFGGCELHSSVSLCMRRSGNGGLLTETFWKVSVWHTTNHHNPCSNLYLIFSPKNWEQTRPGAKYIKMGDFMYVHVCKGTHNEKVGLLDQRVLCQCSPEKHH